MNVMPETDLYKAAFPRRFNGCSGENKVYTEDVGSSSLSSPTINFNTLAAKYEGFRGFNEPRRRA